MAWNESGNGKNPWDRGRQEGPPDLDRIVREWQRRLAGLLSGGRGTPRDTGAKAPGGGPAVMLILVVLVLIWGATGFYRVDDADRGVVLRLGKYQETTLPGLRWHLPWPIERAELVNINEIVPYSNQTRMLTADENIVVVDLVVQYRRADPVNYLFNVRDPDRTLDDVSDSAIREVIGKSKLDFILTEGRLEIAQRTAETIQQTLDDYGTGIVVTKVNLQDANFPSQVEAAVQDAIKAREDKERLAFEAQAYANDVVPRARGEAVRRTQDAEAYRSRVIADAQGEAARFEELLTEYKQAPEVTRERLYIESIEYVLARSTKVLLDSSAGNSLMYLPLDRLLEQRGLSGLGPTGRASGSSATADSSGTAGSREREDRRSRSQR